MPNFGNGVWLVVGVLLIIFLVMLILPRLG
jgi:hypothetical protein